MSDNRATILRVALRLFALHGYDAVGVQQIVTEAGVTKPTLYHYFQSKKGLFETLLQERSAPLLGALHLVHYIQGDLTRTLMQITRVYFDFLQQDAMFYRLMLTTSFAPSSSEVYGPVAWLNGEQFTFLEQLFLRVAEDHGNMRGRHRQYAVSLRGMIDTYAGLSLQGYLGLEGEDLVYRIVHQFMHGIFS